MQNNIENQFQLLNVDDGNYKKNIHNFFFEFIATIVFIAGEYTVPRGQAGVDISGCPNDFIVINGVRLCGEKLNDGSLEEDFTKNAPVTGK